MWPWDELGLAPTSDERLIRKAYAERVRESRPDDDPQRFIRLRAAYEAALATTVEGGKVVRLDEVRSRPGAPKPEPVPPLPPRIAVEPLPAAEPAAKEPPTGEKLTMRNARVRIERVGDSDRTEAPPAPPPAAARPKVRIERVSPEAAATAQASPPAARPKIRIERVATPSDDPSKAE